MFTNLSQVVTYLFIVRTKLVAGGTTYGKVANYLIGICSMPIMVLYVHKWVNS